MSASSEVPAGVPPGALALPICGVLGALRSALAEAPAAVLAAPPGSGKTTVVPLVLLAEPWLADASILLLEPRRLAARAAAARMADLLGEAVGERVGYRVRFENRVSAGTRIQVLTEGILTRRLQADPGLEDVGLVIFDEFHERSLDADLALALTLDVQRSLRPDLRVLIMSATLDTGPVARLLGDAPVVVGGGRSHPVQVRYLPPEPHASIAVAAAAGVRRALAETEGDMLVFLPGGGEIRAAGARLQPVAEAAGLVLHGLYGDLSRDLQDRALRPDPEGRRRVVLATNVAETSLTIEGVRTVVDTGWMRVPRFDPGSGLTRLRTVRVSRASAEQRAGRAGRLGPGTCYRLWTETTQGGLVPFNTPEIQEADLASLVLELARWGVSDPALLAWLDPPPAGSLARARTLLQALGALDARGRVSALGARMAALPLHPRLAHMLLAAAAHGQGERAGDLAALLSEGDILLRGGQPRGADLDDRLAALAAWRRGGDRAAREAGAEPAACVRVDRVARQVRRLADATAASGTWSTGALVALAYPDRIAQRRSGGDARYLLSSGHGVRLADADTLATAAYLAVAQLEGSQGEGRVYLAAGLDLSEVRETLADSITRRDLVVWDPRAQAVSAQRQERLGALVLATRALTDPDPAAIRKALLDGLTAMGAAVLPWTESARLLQARILCLRTWRPTEGWPDLSDAALMADPEDWLAPHLEGISRRDHLQRLDLATILANRLSWEQRRRLDEGAPTHLQVPSGSRIRVQYTPGEAPVLAVRLQELFGLATTPSVCWGEVPLVLHLLSPGQRPIQVTRDLRGFWDRTYPEVKKELQGRYPKHVWPDDPWTAMPTARAKPRR